jgi:hypothetical protein
VTAVSVGVEATLNEISAEDSPPRGSDAAGALDELIDLYTVDLDPIQVAGWLTNVATVPASPIHSMGLATHWKFRPGTPPTPINGVLGSRGDAVEDEDGTYHYVAVVDSGIVVQDSPAWLSEHVEHDPFDLEVVSGDNASHGTFVSGIIRQIAPDHKVTLAKPRTIADPGLVTAVGEDPADPKPPTTELQVAEAILRILSRHPIAGRSDVIDALNLSLGAYTCDPSNDSTLLALSKALTSWTDASYTGGSIFAAGGNEDYPEPFWPAALIGVTGVGATSLSGDEIVWVSDAAQLTADLSLDRSAWVGTMAPGENIVSLQGIGRNLVAWSGSSFATAVASALAASSQSITPDPANISGLSFSEDGSTSVTTD